MKALIVSNRVIDNGQWFSGTEELEDYLTTRADIEVLAFVFWSWKVPKRLLDKYKCYGMHTGYLTEGRGKGGNPIENLQKLGVKWAQLNVFEMTEEFDNGKVILASPIYVHQNKQWMIEAVDDKLPEITAYLEEDRPEIPERFKRV